MDANDGLVLVFLKNAFYKRLHFLALGALGLNILVIAMLFFILMYLLQNPDKPLYFAADDVGRLIQITPVSTPNMSESDVAAWAVEAVQSAYSFDYLNYHQQLQETEKYFITDPKYGRKYGWNSFLDALTLSGNMRGVITRKQIALAQVIGQPKLKGQGTLAGAFAWKYEMPLLVTYSMPPYDGSNQFQNALVVNVTIIRVPVLEGYKGLGILQFLATLPTDASTSNVMQPG